MLVTIQPPLNTYDFRPRRGQRFVEMHRVDLNSRPRRGRTFVSTLFSANLRPLRGRENIEMLHFYKPLTSPRSYGKKHFKAAG